MSDFPRDQFAFAVADDDLAAFFPDQFHNVSRLRYMLGVRHAFDYPAGCHRGPEPYYSVVFDRSDLFKRPVLQCSVLGRCSRGVLFLSCGEP